MARTTSSIISNVLSSFERLSLFMPNFSSLASSSSSSIAQEDVTATEVNSIQKKLTEDLSRLSRILRRIQVVLHDAEEREINEKAIQLWLTELREVAYDAEDVLDQYDYQVIKIVVEQEPSLKRKRVDDDDIYGYQADRTAHWAMPEDSDLDNSSFTEKFARDQPSFEDLDNSSFTEDRTALMALFEDLESDDSCSDKSQSWRRRNILEKDRTALMALFEDLESDDSCSDKNQSWRWHNILGKDSNDSSSEED